MEGYDDDVIRKGTALHDYLIKNNCQEFAVDETLKPTDESVNKVEVEDKLLKTKMEQLNLSASQKKIYKQFIDEILSLGLLLDEDYEILELCVPELTPEPVKSFTKMDLIQASYIIFGSAILWRFRNFFIQFIVFIPAISYLSYRIIEKYKQYSLQKDLNKFLVTVKKLHKTLKKIMRIIEDYSILTIKTDDNTQSNFKSTVLLSHFSESTKSILFDVIVQYRQCICDTLQYISPKLPSYFKNVGEIKSEIDNNVILQRLYVMYLLTQSQCLKMFGLMCCIQFWTNDTKAQIKLFHKNTLCKLTALLEGAHKKAINTLTMFQNVDNIKRKFLTSPIKIRQPQYDVYVNAYQMVLQLHSLLNQSWNVVAKLENELSNEELKQVEKEFDNLSRNIKSLEDFLSICSIKLNKLQNSNNQKENTLLNTDAVASSALKDIKTTDLKVVDLMNDDHSTVVDQIFELYIKRGDAQSDEASLCPENDNELRQDERKATKLVLKELEKVLVFKRDEWNEREARIRELHNQNGENYDPTNSEPVSDESKRTMCGPVQFRHKMKKSDSRQSESSSSEENRQHKDQQYFGPRSTAHILPHPRRISKYKSVRDKIVKPKMATKLMPKNWESNESNDDSDINIPSHPIGFGNIQLPANMSTFRQDEESLSAVGELSDSDSEIK